MTALPSPQAILPARLGMLVNFLLVIVGCGQEVWNGDYVTYEHDAPLIPCGRTPEYVDGFVPFLSGELGLDISRKITYQWLEAGHIPERCGHRAGCAFARLARASDPILLHEVVHTVGFDGALNMHPFLSEGLAVAYDPMGLYALRPRYITVPPGEPRPDPRPLIEDWRGTDASPLEYLTAGSFVAFLLARHGPEKFVALAQALSASPVFTFEPMFRQIYGIELDEESEAFMVGSPCTGAEFPVRMYDCSMPVVAWAKDQWRFSTSMGCDEATVAGGIVPDSGENKIVRSVVLDIPAEGTYTLGVSGDGAIVGVGSCGGCPWTRQDVGATAETSVSAVFPAGPHFVRLVTPAEDSTEVTVSLDPATP